MDEIRNGYPVKAIVAVGCGAGRVGKSRCLDVMIPRRIYDGQGIGTDDDGDITIAQEHSDMDDRFCDLPNLYGSEVTEACGFAIRSTKASLCVGGTFENVNSINAKKIVGLDDKEISMIEMEGMSFADIPEHLRTNNNGDPFILGLVKGIADYAGDAVSDNIDLSLFRTIPGVDGNIDSFDPRANEHKAYCKEEASRRAATVALRLMAKA
ncbi:MAG: hypothetical protein AAF903_13645 [Pseudomonadota bacterium]